ncbi:MAG: Crp/Fnr family transcriptional regulator [Candidatus Delongbacteria bacterium]|nr:Crp/Fnr family transcriptional regulator [Candidatus Delongbacteria bacterium]MCG2759899.1 Crp/Fnr family transcriptional regulator [Candidatus Delongbacteria bacterium]
MEEQSKIEFLRSISLCEAMNETEIKSIAEHCQLKKFAKKNIIFMEQDPGNMFYIIYGGKIKITKLNNDGNEVILSILSTGDFFGEMSLLDHNKRNANAIALDDIELLTIVRNEFLEVLHKNTAFTFNLLKTFAIRLRTTDIRVKSFFLDDAQQKVLMMLYDMSEKMGITKGKGMFLEEMPNQTDLANLTGISRETLSRIIKKFEMNEIIKRNGKDIIIPDYRDFVERFINEE